MGFLEGEMLIWSNVWETNLTHCKNYSNCTWVPIHYKQTITSWSSCPVSTSFQKYNWWTYVPISHNSQGNNNITQIPPLLSMPPSLKHLLLSNNKLSSLEPLSSLQFPSLESLYLAGNELVSARTLRRLYAPNLKYLHLNANYICDYWAYDQILVTNGGVVVLVNLDRSADDRRATLIKMGIILGVKARGQSRGVCYKWLLLH